MRTCLTSLCTACAVRHAATEARCPECGVALVDLRSADGRESAESELVAMAQREPPRPRAVFLLAGAPFLGSAFAAALWLLTHDGPPPFSFVMVFSGAALFGACFWQLVPPLPRRPKAPPTDEPTRTRPSTLPHTPVGATTVRGRVRALRSLRAPLSGEPCVAFGLRGHTARGELADAVVSAFEVETEDGERVVLPEGPASLSLPTHRPAGIADSLALAALLAERGLEMPDARTLTEAVLRDGDEVVVRGVVETRAAADGYRSLRAQRVMVASGLRVITRA